MQEKSRAPNLNRLRVVTRKHVLKTSPSKSRRIIAKTFAQQLVSHGLAEEVYLAGSVAARKAVQSSDIDLVTSGTKNIPRINKICDAYFRRFGVNIVIMKDTQLDNEIHGPLITNKLLIAGGERRYRNRDRTRKVISDGAYERAKMQKVRDALDLIKKKAFFVESNSLAENVTTVIGDGLFEHYNSLVNEFKKKHRLSALLRIVKHYESTGKYDSRFEYAASMYCLMGNEEEALRVARLFEKQGRPYHAIVLYAYMGKLEKIPPLLKYGKREDYYKTAVEILSNTRLSRTKKKRRLTQALGLGLERFIFSGKGYNEHKVRVADF